MRSSALALALLLIASTDGAGAATRVKTDAFEVDAPGKPWKRATALDAPGRVTWDLGRQKTTLGQMRVTFEGAPGADGPSAIARILDLEKARVREGANRSSAIERSAFLGDSMVVGAMKWVGFRVDVKAGERRASVSRWVALHPDFPRRHRAFLVAMDEETLPGALPVVHLKDAHAVLRSLVPRGTGLAGGLETAWLDARTAAFAAHFDTATTLCWRHRGADASPSRAWLGFGRSMALEGDFYQTSDLEPKERLVDAASVDYGAAFDRNGDGKVDLLVMNRGITPARGATVIPMAAIVADDNFDGRVDGSVLENGDANGDGRADHRLQVSDTNRDGKPDQALRFLDGMMEKQAKSVAVKDGIVSARVVGNGAKLLDFASPWREAEALMAEIDRVRAACATGDSARH